MKILLTAVNAKYIHSNLAVYSLAAYASERFACDGARPEIEIAEYTINQPVGRILTDIYMKKPDRIMFSCYIWNRREIEEIVTDLGKVMPDVDIWAGGPEVSFDAADVLGRVPSLKGVICGEGEEIFFELAKIYRDAALRSERPDDSQLQATAGIVFRDRSEEMITTMTHMPIDLCPFSIRQSERLREQDNILREQPRVSVQVQLLSVIGGEITEIQRSETGRKGTQLFSGAECSAGEVHRQDFQL